MTLPAATLDHVVINARDDMDRAADIYRRLGDLQKADAQMKLAEAMDRSSPDDDFSTTMRNKLAGDWKNLFR